MSPDSPELRLLATCASPSPDADAIAKTLEPPLDWPRLLELARWHRLTGFLPARLDVAAHRDRVPASVLERLRAGAVAILTRQRRQQHALAEAVTALDAAGAPAMVLKGAALVATLYPPDVLRPMGDVDLLIRERDLDRAEAVLRRLGYASPEPAARQHAQRRHHRHYPPLLSADGEVCFELHRHVVRPGGALDFDVGGFWRRATSARPAGVETRVPAAADLLLHLLLHLFQDARQKHPSHGALGKLADVTWMLHAHGPELGDGTFAERVDRHGLAGPVLCGLGAAAELLDAPVPAEVTAGLHHPAVDAASVRAFAEHKLLAEPESAWCFHELVEPPDAPTLVNELKSATRRVTRGRAAELASALASAVRRPRHFHRHWRLDRWLVALMS